MRKQYTPVHDKWGVNIIGRNLVQMFPEQTFEWDFGVVHAPNVVNAFCFPGGIVRVTDVLAQIKLLLKLIYYIDFL